MDFTVSFLGLQDLIIGAVRKACADIGIAQGAIVVAVQPTDVPLANTWAGSPETGASVYAMVPVVPGTDTYYREDDGKITGDCAAVALAKVETTKASIKHYEGLGVGMVKRYYTSGALPKSKLGDGLSPYMGGIAIPVGHYIGGHCGHMGAPFLTIFVAVSGGKQEDDETAAWAALEPVKQFTKENYLVLASCFYD